jgi:hypothetical protein
MAHKHKPCLCTHACHMQDHADYIDLNLGCPQRIAKRGYYGAFLMDNLELVRELVSAAATQLKTPVSVKIRLFPELQTTIDYALMLQQAGASLLAIHGRTRDMKVCAFFGPCLCLCHSGRVLVRGPAVVVALLLQHLAVHATAPERPLDMLMVSHSLQTITHAVTVTVLNDYVRMVFCFAALLPHRTMLLTGLTGRPSQLCARPCASLCWPMVGGAGNCSKSLICCAGGTTPAATRGRHVSWCRVLIAARALLSGAVWRLLLSDLHPLPPAAVLRLQVTCGALTRLVRSWLPLVQMGSCPLSRCC